MVYNKASYHGRCIAAKERSHLLLATLLYQFTGVLVLHFFFYDAISLCHDASSTPANDSQCNRDGVKELTQWHQFLHFFKLNIMVEMKEEVQCSWYWWWPWQHLISFENILESGITTPRKQLLNLDCIKGAIKSTQANLIKEKKGGGMWLLLVSTSGSWYRLFQQDVQNFA